MSAPPSLRYQTSIRSAHSRSSNFYRKNWNTSLETLLPKKRARFGSHCYQRTNSANMRASKPRRMASSGNENGNGNGNGSVAMNIERERKMSYGIGGAGNIRRPSDVIYPARTNADGTRRRSSVWSSITVSPGSSPDGKRASLMDLFRKNSVSNSESPRQEVDDNAVHSKEQ